MDILTFIPEMVGDLYFLDESGQEQTPHNLYFLAGYNDTAHAGQATTHYDNALRPVYLCRNRSVLVRPEWAGLSATFRNGLVTDLRED